MAGEPLLWLSPTPLEDCAKFTTHHSRFQYNNTPLIYTYKTMTMVPRSNTHHWEVPKFTFPSPKHANKWKAFYTHSINFLEAFTTDTEVEDSSKKGCRQLKWCSRVRIYRSCRPLSRMVWESWRTRRPPLSPPCHVHDCKCQGTLLALLRWAPLWCQTTPQRRHTYP